MAHSLFSVGLNIKVHIYTCIKLPPDSQTYWFGWVWTLAWFELVWLTVDWIGMHRIASDRWR